MAIDVCRADIRVSPGSPGKVPQNGGPQLDGCGPFSSKICKSEAKV